LLAAALFLARRSEFVAVLKDYFMKGGETPMAIDFYAKEVEKLSTRFDEVYGNQAVCDLRARYSAILTICRIGIIARSVRNNTDEKLLGELTREFSQLRDVLNQFFDRLESEQARRRYAQTGTNERAAAGG
jgi:hypothetical protein